METLEYKICSKLTIKTNDVILFSLLLRGAIQTHRATLNVDSTLGGGGFNC